jgi:hypothetical protein
MAGIAEKNIVPSCILRIFCEELKLKGVCSALVPSVCPRLVKLYCGDAKHVDIN